MELLREPKDAVAEHLFFEILLTQLQLHSNFYQTAGVQIEQKE